jgi:hypothetical protein
VGAKQQIGPIPEVFLSETRKGGGGVSVVLCQNIKFNQHDKVSRNLLSPSHSPITFALTLLHEHSWSVVTLLGAKPCFRHQEREQCTDDADRREALSDELWRVHKQICQTAPTTMAGAAVKLRLLVHPNLGLDALDMSEDDWVSLKQVVEFVSTAARNGEAQP